MARLPACQVFSQVPVGGVARPARQRVTALGYDELYRFKRRIRDTPIVRIRRQVCTPAVAISSLLYTPLLRHADTYITTPLKNKNSHHFITT